MAAYMQNDLRAGSCVVAPIPNAMKSVTEVTVIATPACCIVRPTRSTTPRLPPEGIIDEDFIN